MDEAAILELCKLDIGAKGSSIYDPLILNLMASAKEEIEKEGTKIDVSIQNHITLIVMYVSWLWDRRENPNEPMPRPLRYNLNNELFHQKVSE